MSALRFLNMALVVLLLTMFSACKQLSVDSDQVKVTLVAGQNCQLAKFADLPVRISANHILVPVGIDEAEQFFILDTGAQSSTVTPEFVQSAKLEPTGRKTRTQGVGAITITPDVAVPTMSLGGFVIHNTSMATATLLQPPAPAPRAVGLLGQSVLRAFDM